MSNESNWMDELWRAIESDDLIRAKSAMERAGPGLGAQVSYGDGCHIWGTLALFDKAQEGDTALHLAVRNRALKVAAALASAGLSPTQANFLGMTPRSLYQALAPKPNDERLQVLLGLKSLK
jgi:hypothetical protein